MPGFFIARRTTTDSNGNSVVTDFHFDTVDETEKFISGVTNISLDKTQSFVILSSESEEIKTQFPPRVKQQEV